MAVQRWNQVAQVHGTAVAAPAVRAAPLRSHQAVAGPGPVPVAGATLTHAKGRAPRRGRGEALLSSVERPEPIRVCAQLGLDRRQDRGRRGPAGLSERTARVQVRVSFRRAE